MFCNFAHFSILNALPGIKRPAPTAKPPAATVKTAAQNVLDFADDD
jgi:hypothetical protein